MRFRTFGVHAFVPLTTAASAALGLRAGAGGAAWQLALAVALAAAAGFGVSRSIARSLGELTKAAGRAAQSGCIPGHFPAGSSIAEVNLLAEALNSALGSIRHSKADLDQAQLQFVEAMAEVLDARDPYTAGHSLRVASYAHAIACAIHIPPEQAEKIRVGAQLHDIGKVGIPDAVLQKGGDLSAAEYGLIKLHPQIGRRILEKMGGLQDLLSVVELHHENYDGTGYPFGLAGEKIPLAARIVRVADAFDAMVTDRHYRDALPVRVAVEELRAHAGTQFDPRLVQVMLKLIEEGKLDGTVAGREPLLRTAQHPIAIGALVQQSNPSPRFEVA